MPEIHVTTAMLDAGLAAAAAAPFDPHSDSWFACVYRAMREVEPPLCRGEPVEILCCTTSQIEAAVERFARRIEDMAR